MVRHVGSLVGLGLVVCALLAGCDKGAKTEMPTATAPAPAAPENPPGVQQAN